MRICPSCPLLADLRRAARRGPSGRLVIPAKGVSGRPEAPQGGGELPHRPLGQRGAEAMLELVVEGGPGLGEKRPARRRELVGGVISSYYSGADRPAIPYWALGFKDSTLRLLGSDDFPATVKAAAAAALTDALLDGSLHSGIAARFPLDQIAGAHELVESGARGRVMIDVTPPG